MKISFDFDNTLTQTRMQKLAKLLIEQGHEVVITTARYEEEIWDDSPNMNKDIEYLVHKELGIEEIRYTEMNPKVDYLHDCDIHFDDDPLEIEMIEKAGIDCIGIIVSSSMMDKIS